MLNMTAGTLPPAPGEAVVFNLYQFHFPSVDVRVLQFASDDDPAVFAIFSSDAMLDNVCALPNCPIVQGATPAASAINVRQWVSNQFLAVNPACAVVNPFPGIPPQAFHLLTQQQFFTVCGLLTPVWVVDVFNAGLSFGCLYVCTPTGTAAGPAAQRYLGSLLFR